jgi:hypothetical protein
MRINTGAVGLPVPSSASADAPAAAMSQSRKARARQNRHFSSILLVLRFKEALERYRKRRLTEDEVGELRGMSRRHFRRLTVRNEEGQEGLHDRR